METDTSAQKPTNWYSGWRLLVTSAVTVLAVKLTGLLGAAAALLAFFWLQPKRGTVLAIAAAVVVGLAVAVVSSVVLQSTDYGKEAPPTQKSSPAASDTDWWKNGSTPVN